ncbi:hypothetical protein [Methylocystis sp. SC2]|uniref:hypothetical protein n=1 Tax=Methylocystis sp. (strain SC2) TaxID=187303 RepID=UPI000319DA16|nr:hypothetical protein [Methylocystis sp. SC2]
MLKYPLLILLGLTLAAGAAQSKGQAKAPKNCLPILRAAGGAPTRPYGQIPYSVWYYVLYQPVCDGKSEQTCIWACGKPPSRDGDAE